MLESHPCFCDSLKGVLHYKEWLSFHLVICVSILYMFYSFQLSILLISLPSVGSCHHGMARPLGCGWRSRPPDMEISCEYIE